MNASDCGFGGRTIPATADCLPSICPHQLLDKVAADPKAHEMDLVDLIEFLSASTSGEDRLT